MNRTVLTLFLAIGILASTAIAHDASKHKGKATVGEIVSLGDDRFELKTATGTVPVKFSSKTKFEHGNAAVDKTHLQKGGKVTVIGTKLANGDLVAKEVLLGVPSAKSAGGAKMDHSKMEKGQKPKPEHKH